MSRLTTGALAALVAAGLSGCQAPLEWYKEGVTPSDYAADQTYCKGAEDLVPSYTPDNEMHWVRLYQIEAYNNCMESRGYRLIEPGTEPRPARGKRTAQGQKP
jgi:hypothetical protein